MRPREGILYYVPTSSDCSRGPWPVGCDPCALVVEPKGQLLLVQKFLSFAFFLIPHLFVLTSEIPPSGKDATEAFFAMHRTDVLIKYDRLVVGILDSHPKGKPRAIDYKQPGTLSKVPYAEVAALSLGWKSPNMTEDHIAFRKAVRAFYDTELRPYAERHTSAGKTPTKEMFLAMGKAGILAAHLAPSKLLAETCERHGISLPGNLPWAKFDQFAEQIVHEEHSRLGFPGFQV